jgi:aspartate kinase
VSLLVQKFGGTSVADANRIQLAASKAIRAHRNGNGVVVVVSARGHTTDELIAAAAQLSAHPPAREMDMLLSTGEQVSVALMAIAIQAFGIPAISFTGGQIGLVTDSSHTRARIRGISTEKMAQALEEGKIVIVAGFQGVDEHDNITTLGRGGSDTTAVALAAALGADACEIYTDVDGVHTTDPRIVPEARKIDRISYDEMLELASLGAGVMHSRSIESAKKYGVPIHVRNASSDAAGTWIVADVDARLLGHTVTGTALARDEARITVSGLPDRPGAVAELLGMIAESDIGVDMIVQNVASGGTIKVSFTVAASDLSAALRVAELAGRALGAAGVTHDGNVSKLSVVGLGMRTHAGVAATMFEALAEAGINIAMITTSEIKISVLVDRAAATEALRAVHRAFRPERRSTDAPLPFTPKLPCRPTLPLIDVVDGVLPAAPRSALEDLVISGVEIDDRLVRITVLDVPDHPGYAARIFRRVADSDVYVDMIVQNVGTAGTPNLSFMIRRSDAERAAEAVAAVVGEDGFQLDPCVAKLSVRGVGMRSHVGVAARVFEALAEHAIGPVMINTSEIRINVVVERDRAPEALECLSAAFLRKSGYACPVPELSVNGTAEARIR